jgi:deoxyribodipyrimidine photo-lyase
MSIVNIMWFRRDLRLNDNAALYHALKSNYPVIPIFIFDTHILDKLSEKDDARVSFIHDSLLQMQQQLLDLNSSLEIYYGTPETIFKKLFEKHNIHTVYTNHDYEAYGIERDAQILKLCQSKNANLLTYKDHVLFEKNEVVKDDGQPYTVFTPYSKKWKTVEAVNNISCYQTENYLNNFYQQKAQPIITLNEIGFKHSEIEYPSAIPNAEIIQVYNTQRDYPGINSTSKLGLHLRFGTISIRALAILAKKTNETFLNELIWRDFYNAILYHYPHINKGIAFRPIYDKIEWRNNKAEFEAWCNGKTGYPIVDAGMRELNATGFMHNRVRMITASFLVKHLLIDWRWGEAYFAKKLLDFDFASNNGGWQWASSSGCDAAPYFRIFNPTLQMDKFDKNRKYINKWVPELQGFNYIKPIVVHEEARKRVLDAYAKVLKPN